MKKEDFIKLGFTEEQAEKAAEASAEELKGFIPKSRFDEVNEEKKTLDAEIKKRDGQIEALKKVDAQGLQAEIEKLQAENKAAIEKYEADLKTMKIDGAVERALLGSKAKNIKAVKALLNLDGAEIDGDSIKGLEDQIKKLQEAEDSKFLFDIASKDNQSKPNVYGAKPAERSDGGQAPKASNLTEALQNYFTK